jgi:hypothetical protein
MDDIEIPIIGMDAVTYRHAEHVMLMQQRINRLRMELGKYAQRDNWTLDRDVDMYNYIHDWFDAEDGLKYDERLADDMKIALI